MNDVTMVTCSVRNDTHVDIRDQRGNLVDTYCYPCPVTAQSFGNGITVSLSSGTTYVYTLQDGHLEQTGCYIS